MNEYIQHIKLFFKRWLIVMAMFTIVRVFFFIFNYTHFVDLAFGEVIMHFIYGFKFDLVTFGLFNLILVFLSFLPDFILSKKWYQSLIMWLFLVVNSILLVPNIVDIKFYEFEEKRLTADIFNDAWLGADFLSLLPSFMKDYWFLFIGFLVFVYLFYKIYPKFEFEVFGNKIKKSVRIPIQIFICLFFTGVFFVSARGGLALKPINIISAARYTTPNYMPLILNSSFSIIKTVGGKSLDQYVYYQADELDSIFTPETLFVSDKEFNKKNIIIIILESFGREYSGTLNNNKGLTPVFDSIMNKSLVLTNAYANGKRSIEAVPSIISGIPSLMDEALLTSQYAANNMQSLAMLLNKKGYTSSFFHGGENGTMRFDYYADLAGINNYYGVNEYPYKEGFDGGWGIYDEPFFNFTLDELGKGNSPFFATIFTISSHHPYHIPKEYKDRFPKGNLVNSESIGYSDYALGQFMKKASKQPWYNNTLFVFSADHTAQTSGGFYNTGVGRYAIPIVFFDPSNDSLVGNFDRVCQQADIFPSIMDYLNYNGKIFSFGKSLFNAAEPRYAVSYRSGIYQIIYEDIVLSFDGKKVVSLMKIIDGNQKNVVNTESNEKSEKALALLKAIIQQYNYGLEHNKMNPISYDKK